MICGTVRKYKDLLLVLTISVIGLWYVGINHSTYVNDENRDYLSASEVKELYETGIIGKPRYDEQYFKTEKVEYIKTRTLIPFITKKDTLSHDNVSYWSTKR